MVDENNKSLHWFWCMKKILEFYVPYFELIDKKLLTTLKYLTKLFELEILSNRFTKGNRLFQNLCFMSWLIHPNPFQAATFDFSDESFWRYAALGRTFSKKTPTWERWMGIEVLKHFYIYEYIFHST
jgi:hypothetical protein